MKMRTDRHRYCKSLIQKRPINVFLQYEVIIVAHKMQFTLITAKKMCLNSPYSVYIFHKKRNINATKIMNYFIFYKKKSQPKGCDFYIPFHNKLIT